MGDFGDQSEARALEGESVTDRHDAGVEGQVRRLLEGDAIAHLLHEYCRCMDVLDAMGVARLFTDDCLVDYGPGAQIRGSAGLAEGIPRFQGAFRRTQHQLSNIQVDFEGPKSARSLSYVRAWHEYPDGRPDYVLYAQYRDRLVRTEAGWRIAERRLIAMGQKNLEMERTWLERNPLSG